jgi:hypothetical protein
LLKALSRIYIRLLVGNGNGVLAPHTHYKDLLMGILHSYYHWQEQAS